MLYRKRLSFCAGSDAADVSGPLEPFGQRHTGLTLTLLCEKPSRKTAHLAFLDLLGKSRAPPAALFW